MKDYINNIGYVWESNMCFHGIYQLAIRGTYIDQIGLITPVRMHAIEKALVSLKEGESQLI